MPVFSALPCTIVSKNYPHGWKTTPTNLPFFTIGKSVTITASKGLPDVDEINIPLQRHEFKCFKRTFFNDYNKHRAFLLHAICV